MASRPTTTTIERYLDELRHRLPGGGSAWQRIILAEVEDHLRSATEELDAEKVEHAGAEREAIERFGPVESVAGELVAEYGLRETRRTISILAVVIAVFLGFSMLSSGGPLLTGHVGALLPTLSLFVLTQVAWATLALTGLRALVMRRHVRVTVADFQLLARGGGVALGSLAAALLVRVAVLMPGGASLLELVSWISMVVALALAGLAIARSVRLLSSFGPPLEAAGRGGAGEARDLDADAEALATILETGSPLSRPVLRLLERRVAGALSVRRHPWRLAGLVGVLAALLAFEAGAMADGLWPALATAGPSGWLTAGAVCAAVEAVAVLGAYLLLGRYLALRPALHERFGGVSR